MYTIEEIINIALTGHIESDDELINNALLTTKGRLELGKRYFIIDPLPQGNIPEYDKELDCRYVLMEQCNG